MPTTTLTRAPGESWAAAGRAVAGGLGALLQGEAVRQRARQEQEELLANIYMRNMQGNQAGALALRADEEARGLRLTGDARQAPIDETLPRNMQVAQRLFQMTGDTNMQRFAEAGTALQMQGIRDQALAAVDDVDRMNRLNVLTRPGETYLPFAAVGETGGAIDRATGQGRVFDEAMRVLFADESAAQVARDRGAAAKSQAGAAADHARATKTRAEIERIRADMARPDGGGGGGGRSEGSEGALSSTFLQTLQVPALDSRGRPVVNPLTGEMQMRTDTDALNAFYAWLHANNRRPTATAMVQWEALGRPAGTATTPAAPALAAAPAARPSPATAAQSDRRVSGVVGAAPAAPGRPDVAAALAAARSAIARGAPRDKVIERLRQNGIDPAGL